jgi:hypothetical protein
MLHAKHQVKRAFSEEALVYLSMGGCGSKLEELSTS